MSLPLRVLLVEDSEDDAELTVRELRRGGREIAHERVDRRGSMVEALDRGGWDVVIADYAVPGFGGLEALALVKERGLDIPFLIVSGAIGEETAVEAMKAGAHDYVMKGRLERLPPAIERELAEAEGRRERRRAEGRLREALAEKETLLREIHHRVKNNLQVVYSLINMQARRTEDPKVLAGLSDCRDRVRAMAMVHEKLYRSSDLSRIDFAEHIRDVADSLLLSIGDAGRKIRLRVEAEPVLLGLEEAVPCGLIVHELVSNGLKHAFPGGKGGEIRVSFRRKGEAELFLEVSDDGVGLPPNFNFNDVPSLGLRLVGSLVKQLDGSIRTGSDRGASFALSWPDTGAPKKKEIMT